MRNNQSPPRLWASLCQTSRVALSFVRKVSGLPTGLRRRLYSGGGTFNGVRVELLAFLPLHCISGLAIVSSTRSSRFVCLLSNAVRSKLFITHVQETRTLTCHAVEILTLGISKTWIRVVLALSTVWPGTSLPEIPLQGTSERCIVILAKSNVEGPPTCARVPRPSMSFRSGELAIASMEVCTNTQGSVQQSPRNREGESLHHQERTFGVLTVRACYYYCDGLVCTSQDEWVLYRIACTKLEIVWHLWWKMNHRRVPGRLQILEIFLLLPSSIVVTGLGSICGFLWSLVSSASSISFAQLSLHCTPLKQGPLWPPMAAAFDSTFFPSNLQHLEVSFNTIPLVSIS